MKGMFLKKCHIYCSKWATVVQKFQLSMTKLGTHDGIRWFDGTYRSVFHVFNFLSLKNYYYLANYKLAEKVYFWLNLSWLIMGSFSPATIVFIACASVGVGDPDPYVLGHPRPAPGSVSHNYGSGSGSFYHEANIVRKTLIFTVL